MGGFDRVADVGALFFVYFVSGAFFVIYIGGDFPLLNGLVVLGHSEYSGLPFAVTSMVLGALLYSVWSILFRPLALVLKMKALSPCDVQLLLPEKINAIKLTYENDFRMFQFYGSLGMVFLAHIVFAKSIDLYAIVVDVIFFISSIVTSVFSYGVYRERILNLK